MNIMKTKRRILKILKIIELHMIIMKNMKIIEFHMRIKKIYKILEIDWKTWKTLNVIIPGDNYGNIENHRIQKKQIWKSWKL